MQQTSLNRDVTYDQLAATYHEGHVVSAPLRLYSRRADKQPAPGGFFYDDQAEHVEYETLADDYIAEWLSQNLEEGSLLGGIRDVEVENLEKAKSYYRHRPAGYALFTEPLIHHGRAEDEEYCSGATVKWLEMLLRRVDLSSLAEWRDVRVRIGTACGWPTYAPGSDVIERLVIMRQRLVHGMPFARTVETLRKLSRSIHEGHVGSDPLTVRFTRIQGSRKGWPTALNIPAARLCKVGLDPISPKHRAVFNFGVYGNQYKWGLHAALAALLHSVPFFPTRVDLAMQYFRTLGLHDKDVFPEDITSFDLSITSEQLAGTLRGISSFFKNHGDKFQCVHPVEITSLDDVFAATASTPVVTPAMSQDRDAIMVYEKAGTLPSGSQLTSVLGSIINGALRIVGKYAKIRGISREAAIAELHDGKWGFVCASDDTLLALPKGMRKEWDSVSFMGFTTTTQGWPVFLQRILDFDKMTNYGIVSRMWSGMINREEPKESYDRDIIDLGIQVRRKLLEGHPRADLFDAMCSKHPRTATALHRSIQHSLEWHERKVASKVALGKGDEAGIGSAWDWYTSADPSSLSNYSLEETLSSRRTASVGELLASCSKLSDSDLPTSALRRLEMQTRKVH